MIKQCKEVVHSAYVTSPYTVGCCLVKQGGHPPAGGVGEGVGGWGDH